MAGGKAKIHEHPKAGSSTFRERPQDINKSGAPQRKLVATVIETMKEAGVEPATAPQIKDSYLRFLNLTETELQEIVADKDQPMLNRIVAKAILGNKGFEVIAQLLDRAIGKPNQSIDVTATQTISRDYDFKIIDGE
jgi:hypothetical protein